MMTLSTRLFALCLCLVIVGFAGTAVATAPATTASQTADAPLAQQDIDADDVVMTADVAENGDAQWRVAYRIRLDSDEEIQAFEDLQADIEANRSAYLGTFTNRMERTVADAENATGREMTASEFQVSTDRQSQPDAEFGVVTYQFQWSGFAAVEADGDRLRAGDAIDRLFLDEGVRLQVRWPDAFGFKSADPDLDDQLTVEDNRAVWTGPLDFDTGQPRVVVSRAATADDAADDGSDDGTDGTAGDDGTDDVPADESGSSQQWALFVALVVVALVAGAGGFALWDRSAEDGDAGASAAAATGAETDDGPPPELLSNEERVLQLLEDSGGRMKQQAVAEQLDWTAAKTSQVVSDLREDDAVESFRLGRENVLTLPDVDIDADTGDEESDEQE